MNKIKLIIFADKHVGKETIRFLLTNYPDHVSCIIVTDKESEILSFIINETNFNKNYVLFNTDLKKENDIQFLKEINPDYILLAWWPFIIKEPILLLPKIGTINFHPSLLPYNRGKHYNFWTIVEDTPFGVTIHFVDNSIDGGDIIFQKEIEKTWEDTGQTLYQKAQRAMLELFFENYKRIVDQNYKRIKQDCNKGSFHYGKELEPASQIILEKEYKAKDLLNLIRARTFPLYPGCYFYNEKGEKFEIRIEIKKVDDK